MNVIPVLILFMFFVLPPLYANSHIDFDKDRDVDGKDLVAWISQTSDPKEIAAVFGSAYRSFYMASTPFRHEVSPGHASSVFDFEAFDSRVDMVSIHTDNFFGLPWDEFKPGGARVESWHQVMAQIKNEMDRLGVGIYLSLTPLKGLRDSIAAKAVDKNGALDIDVNWYQGCYDFDADPENVRQAFLNYVRWMVDYFKPRYLTHGIEVNMYMDTCPDDYDSLIRLLNDVYDQEKTIQPELPVFPSFTAKKMWSYGHDGDCEIGDRTCLISNINRQKTLKRDRWAISAYPIFLQWEWGQMPHDYFKVFHELTGEKIVFAETGQGSSNVTWRFPTPVDPCFQVFTSSDQAQTDYLNLILTQANQLNADLVVWWSLRDFLFEQILTECPYEDPGTWGDLYTAVEAQGLIGAWLMWGSMGVLDFDGQLKPAYSIWKHWLALPFIPD